MDNLYDISEGVAKRTINQPSITCDDVKINMDPTERLIGQYSKSYAMKPVTAGQHALERPLLLCLEYNYCIHTYTLFHCICEAEYFQYRGST